MSFGKVLLRFSLEGGPIADIDNFLDNDRIIIAQYSREEASPTLSIININSGQIEKVIEKTYDDVNTILKVICNRELNKLVYTTHLVGEFHIISYDLETNQKQIIKKCSRPEAAVSYTINPSTNNLYIALPDGTVEVWNIKDNCLSKKITLKKNSDINLEDEPMEISFSPDGNFLAVGKLEEKAILLFDATDYKLIYKFATPFKTPGNLVFDFNNRLLFATDYWQKGIIAWNIETKERYGEDRINERKQKITSLMISPDNKYFIMGSGTSTVNIFSLTQPKRLHNDKLHSPGTRVYGLCITDDCSKLISAGDDRVIIIRKLAE